MKLTVIIDPAGEEEIILRVREHGETENKIRELIGSGNSRIVGYGEREILPLDASAVSAFFVEKGRTYASLRGERLRVDLRIYELEQMLGRDFVKVNQSCLINVSHIEKFDASFSGALVVITKDGVRECVSRRQLKAVKERIGFKL